MFCVLFLLTMQEGQAACAETPVETWCPIFGHSFATVIRPINQTQEHRPSELCGLIKPESSAENLGLFLVYNPTSPDGEPRIRLLMQMPSQQTQLREIILSDFGPASNSVRFFVWNNPDANVDAIVDVIKLLAEDKKVTLVFMRKGPGTFNFRGRKWETSCPVILLFWFFGKQMNPDFCIKSLEEFKKMNLYDNLNRVLEPSKLWAGPCRFLKDCSVISAPL